MIVVMKPGAPKRQIDEVVALIEQLGLRSHLVEGSELTVVAALGEKRDGAKQALETMEGVEKVVPILAPYKMASMEVKREPTVVTARNLTVGGGRLGIVAGPCSVESREEILEIAKLVQEAGAAGLRGGAFKPRTSPYSFQGLKEKGLQLLAEARDATGLAVVTEVMAKEQVDLVANYADVLQVGARNMQNYPLLEAVGESSLPVLLKRGPSATMDEFLLAAEYVLKTGNQQVILCERGIRTFESATRNTLDISAVPIAQRLSHLPVIVDPSHSGGRRDLVLPLSRAAIAVGADGIIVDVHPHPETALCDGPQALIESDLRELASVALHLSPLVGRTLTPAPALTPR